jgi:DinB superfamily
MTEIKTKTELITALKDSHQRVTTRFIEIPVENFFTRQGEVWSPSDNVDHLIKSHKPIAKALKLPKFTLQAMFGKPEKPSITYEDLCQIYRDELAKGAQASGRYLPNQESPGKQAEEKKKELLEQFSKASAELVSIAEKWDENELDGYLLPHPLIGKLTIREMLFFTIYHNLRHASQEGD